MSGFKILLLILKNNLNSPEIHENRRWDSVTASFMAHSISVPFKWIHSRSLSLRLHWSRLLSLRASAIACW
jgi:hypothetical protein